MPGTPTTTTTTACLAEMWRLATTANVTEFSRRPEDGATLLSLVAGYCKTFNQASDVFFRVDSAFSLLFRVCVEWRAACRGVSGGAQYGGRPRVTPRGSTPSWRERLPEWTGN